MRPVDFASGAYVYWFSGRGSFPECRCRLATLELALPGIIRVADGYILAIVWLTLSVSLSVCRHEIEIMGPVV